MKHAEITAVLRAELIRVPLFATPDHTAGATAIAPRTQFSAPRSDEHGAVAGEHTDLHAGRGRLCHPHPHGSPSKERTWQQDQTSVSSKLLLVCRKPGPSA